MRLTRHTRIRRSNLKRCLLLLLFPLLFSFCGKHKPAVRIPGLPADSIIPQEEMVKMLVDVHLLEAALHLIRGKGIASEKAAASFYYNHLFSKYHMTEKRFHLNLDYLQADPEYFMKVYDEVILDMDQQKSLEMQVKPKKK